MSRGQLMSVANLCRVAVLSTVLIVELLAKQLWPVHQLWFSHMFAKFISKIRTLKFEF